MNTDREPTEFELRVLRRIGNGRFQGGDRQVHFCAAARRLEKMGYAVKTEHWYLTGKGRSYLEAHPKCPPSPSP